jgi:predicted dehydrogenase
MLMTLDEDADEELSSGEQLPQENTHFFPHNTLLRVGIVVEAISSTEAGVVAASSPEESSIIAAVGRSSISNCCVTSFVVLDNKLQQGQNTSSQEAIAREWLEHSGCSPSPDKVRILYGPTGLQVVLDNPTLVDAVLVLTSASTQHMYVMQALRARKHVLFYDRVSQPLHEFQEQLKLAFRVGRFLQSSTMFVHHHRVKVFMACVNNEKTFGNLESIHAKLLVNYDDASRIMGAKFPLARRGDGCVRRLGRYCVLITSLLLSRAGSRPVSAHVVPRYEHEDDKEPTEAKGTVTFTGNRVLTFHVAYTSIATRQILEVHAPTRYATMTDFVLPHRDGLATYRVYHKDVVPLSGKLEVVKAESLDVMSGPPQDVMMWRDFSILCDAVERYGYSSPQAAGSRELASVANCTKRVLLALEESIATGREVPVAVEEVVL